jgi:hypothetical protein
MRNTIIHLMAALGWVYVFGFFMFLVLANTAFYVGVLTWSAGLGGIVGSWIYDDAPTHAVSRRIARSFVYAAVLLPIVPIFPYLIISRGLKGLLAAIALLLLLWFMAVWTIPILVSLFIDFGYR